MTASERARIRHAIDQRVRTIVADDPDPDAIELPGRRNHGSAGGYAMGCRCGACREWSREAKRVYREKRRKTAAKEGGLVQELRAEVERLRAILDAHGIAA